MGVQALTIRLPKVGDPLSVRSFMGALISYFAEAFPPKSRFSVNDIPDLTGKVMVVTGELSCYLEP